jgi:hypothetical protein
MIAFQQHSKQRSSIIIFHHKNNLFPTNKTKNQPKILNLGLNVRNNMLWVFSFHILLEIKKPSKTLHGQLWRHSYIIFHHISHRRCHSNFVFYFKAMVIATCKASKSNQCPWVWLNIETLTTRKTIWTIILKTFHIRSENKWLVILTSVWQL